MKLEIRPTYKTYVNGVVEDDVVFIEDRDIDYQNNWYVKDVFFPAQSYTETRVIYTAPYGQGFRIEYDFSTGYNWYGDIDESKFILIQKADIWPMGLRIDGYEYEISPFVTKGSIDKADWNDSDRNISKDFFLRREADGRIEIILKDVNPYSAAGNTYFICTQPFWASETFTSPYRAPAGFNKMVERDPERFKSYLNLISLVSGVISIPHSQHR